jgi:hypothetical protein
MVDIDKGFREDEEKSILVDMLAKDYKIMTTTKDKKDKLVAASKVLLTLSEIIKSFDPDSESALKLKKFAEEQKNNYLN